jgi:hypothetical protein
MTAMTQSEKEKPGLFARYVPILHWLPRYDKAWLAGDTIAGLSVWALMVPQCLGFAAIGTAAGGIIGAIAGDTPMGLAIGAAAGGYLYDRHEKSKEKAYEEGYKEGQKKSQ